MTCLSLGRLSLLSAALLLGACAVGPDYERPNTAVSAQFKEAAGWKTAAPSDQQLGDAWWQLYGDAELNQLIGKLNVSNQNLAAAEAQYRQARALLGSARAAFYPTLSAGAGVNRSGQGGGSSTLSTSDGISVSGANAAQISKSYDLSLNAAWELDVWGKLRRGLESSNASFEASAADLAAMRLSLQSELAQSYLQLRVLDEQARLLNATVAAYARSLQLTENQYQAGIVPKSDVSQARTQLHSTRAQAIDLEWQRAQREHAIAVLIGVAPSELSIAVRDSVPALPAVPLALPSQLLERRPDIASAERKMIAANAEIGVAEAAWYPDLSLSASGGYNGGSFDDWVSLPNRVWSIGPQLALTLFDGGARRAQVDSASASHQQTVATYRQTVLDSFREVEDYLVQLRVLEQEAGAQQQAVDAAVESLRSLENQYRAGIVDYNSVVSVQTSALSNQRSALSLLGTRLTASVQLIAALGGGWDSAQLQTPTESSPPVQ
ncbi:MAG TPA: efflux transporter outer membrane subunit [Pseudomonas sp.]|uniref:efflux transporter outer membrane subunit n=1 Tax=Pseudomonas sp. TaxID=306 RepID=UPI002BE72C01|nr:efflux transporter outer membrane subunit [Pseudomonas sp.]HRL94757.1 efflux transporter outer membrane subunit [Pseudomonas sp.]